MLLGYCRQIERFSFECRKVIGFRFLRHTIGLKDSGHFFIQSEVKPKPIGHVRYINIQAWLRGFWVKIANFSSFFCSSVPKRDLDTKKTTLNVEVCPESLGAMLEYWYIERGLLWRVRVHFSRALRQLPVITSSFDWFTALSASFVIG